MSNSLIAVIIYSYFESKRRINDPLMPGRIIAVIAIDPVKKIKMSLSGILVVLDREIIAAIVICVLAYNTVVG